MEITLPELIAAVASGNQSASSQPNPMLGRRCLVRTYSAGVHIGSGDG